ncbi:MAG: hypothetical protein H6968_11620 [Chromatiaceae bacterium]|nr:hypothetical protein [Chromatiaceae bacterium]
MHNGDTTVHADDQHRTERQGRIESATTEAWSNPPATPWEAQIRQRCDIGILGEGQLTQLRRDILSCTCQGCHLAGQIVVVLTRQAGQGEDALGVVRPCPPETCKRIQDDRGVTVQGSDRVSPGAVSILTCPEVTQTARDALRLYSLSRQEYKEQCT